MMNGKSPKFNILYFAPCGIDEGIGGGARLRNMVEALAQLGADIQLISYLPKEKFSIINRQVNNRLNTTTVSVKKSSPKILKLFALGLIFIYGLRHISQKTIILAHASGIASGFPAFILAKMFRKPLIVDLTDVKDPDTPKFIYNVILKNSDAIFAVSRYLAEKAKEIGGRNVVHVPVIIDSDVFQKNVVGGAEIRAKLGINDKEIVIGYAGSFWYIEGLSFLLKAFKKLHDKYENVKLVLVGGRNVPGSDDVPQLIQELAISDRVILVPQQPHELMPKYLSAFDIACSPKIDCPENRAASPIKTHEYMSMGLPVVVSAVGEIAEMIEDGIDGFLVKPGDEKDLARVLEYVIQNLNSAKEAGEKAREKIISHYTREAVLTTIRDTLKFVILPPSPLSRSEIGPP